MNSNPAAPESNLLWVLLLHIFFIPEFIISSSEIVLCCAIKHAFILPSHNKNSTSPKLPRLSKKVDKINMGDGNQEEIDMVLEQSKKEYINKVSQLPLDNNNQNDILL